MLMRKQDDCESSQQQGFYKPQLKVVVPIQEKSHLPKSQSLICDGNELIYHNRPSDYLPRVLSKAPPIYNQLLELDLVSQNQLQQLLPIRREKAKKCKYLSLKDKYYNNELYQLAYSKIGANEEFNSYIFSLNNTTDYNPNDYQTPLSEGREGSKFQSRFQSGNLLYAYRCMDSKIQQYDLILQNDTNTKGYNQWFYFSFRNDQSTSVRFNIVNLIKKHSLFEEGVRPVGFSTKNSHFGWHPVGKNIDYQKSYVSREIQLNGLIDKNYYTLSFTIDFTITNDTFYLALNFPYTYSRMIRFLNELPSLNSNAIIDRGIICHTISNNALPFVKIRHSEYKAGGKKILIMGRQHPGQTVGSFVLEGFINNAIIQDKIIRNYQIIIIPMLNPDGVIYGNFRTNLAGFDLNRQWIEPNKHLHPQIFYVNRFISQLQNISFVIDFHGHSKKYNSFIFACTGEVISQFRLFPYICSKTCDKFSLKDCSFNITADKQRTARIKMFREIKKPQVFTLQTSFFGYEGQNQKKYRFQIKDLMNIGLELFQSLKIYLFKKKQLQIFEKQVKEKDYIFDQWAFQNRDDIDSESNPSQDELTPFERKEKVMVEKDNKKRLKSKKKKQQKKKLREKSQMFGMFQAKYKNCSNEKQVPSIPEQQQKIAVKSNLQSSISIKKKPQSVKVINLNEVKIKRHKVLSIKVQPPLKNIVPITPKITPSSILSTDEIVKKQKAIVLQKVRTPSDSKIKGEIMPITTRGSNLFNTTNYYCQLQQKLKSKSNNSNIHQKTHSLQINNLKKQTISPNGSTMDVLRRLISNQDQQDSKFERLQNPSNRLKHKQKIYIIRENRIINSVTRTNQQEIKKDLQSQINNRTQALKNCQKKMREMSLQQPILSMNEQLFRSQPNRLYLTNLVLKSYKFPTLRLQKKIEYYPYYDGGSKLRLM